MTALPLSGIRVVDFCWVGAGSFATKILADHGADVIKIESNSKIDGIRLSPPFKDGRKDVNRSGYFADRNTNKRSLTLNMKTDEGQQLARRLVASCDVVSNNFTPGVMERFGLGYEQVREINPGVVYLAMSMQGAAGPERDYLGYGQTIGALVGLHHLTGLPGHPPAGTGTNYPDHVPNPCHAAFAVLAALRHKRRTGRGQFVDIAQTEPTIAMLAPSLLEHTVNGHDPGPLGNQHRSYAPHGVYRCSGEDSWLAISVTDDDAWQKLRTVLGIDDAQCVSDWADAAARWRDRDTLDDLLARLLADRDAAETADHLLRAGVAAGVVQSVADLVDDDPQLRWREHWVRLDHPEMGETLYNAPPFRFSGTPTRFERPAPLLGQHTREICRDVLGLADAEIDRLTEAGVLT
ncbi:MAG: CoA transferase [Streptosporangiales bacterium]|nr:CoA transferase [Streptosporangiales bacterium]